MFAHFDQLAEHKYTSQAEMNESEAHLSSYRTEKTLIHSLH